MNQEEKKGPLDWFVNAMNNKEKPPEKQKEQNYEDIVFSVIVAAFVVGIISFISLSSPLVGNVILEGNTDTIYLKQLILDNSDIRLNAKGNLTSLRITGEFIGDGTAKIYLGDKLVIDSSELENNNNNLITGFVVYDEPINYSDEEVLPPDFNEVSEQIIEDSVQENDSFDPKDKIQENLSVENSENTTQTNSNESILLQGTEEVLNESAHEINETLVNITFQENITVELNETIVENITEDISENITDETVKLLEFDSYCLETCALAEQEDKIVLMVELDDMILNLTSVTYTYDVLITNDSVEENLSVEINATFNKTINITDNTTLNITSNVSQNASLDLTINVTENISLNVTANLTSNISLNQTLNTSINTTEINITKIIKPIFTDEFLVLNLSLKDRGVMLASFENYSSGFNVSLISEEGNSANLFVNNLDDVDIDFFNIEDTRVNSNAVIIGENVYRAEIELEYEKTDTVLQCLQVEQTRKHNKYIRTCKKWIVADIPFEVRNRFIYFTVDKPGLYALAELDKESKEFIQTNSIYSLADCDSCEAESNCYSDQFCVFQNLKPTRDGVNAQFGYLDTNSTNFVTFVAQLDFDVLNLRDSFEKAEVCAYSYYDAGETTINYIKSSEKLSCSEFTQEYYTSALISYEVIEPDLGWKCIDATKIVKDSIEKRVSNVFINWMGQDLNGKTSPYNCYRALTSLNGCGGYNPSGADDCRPYLKLTYK